jgi:hypothetical protein
VQIPGLSVGTREFTLPARGVSAARPLGGDAENIPACVQAGFCHEVRLGFDSALPLR